jgi:hypothetical protein
MLTADEQAILDKLAEIVQLLCDQPQTPDIVIINELGGVVHIDNRKDACPK